MCQEPEILNWSKIVTTSMQKHFQTCWNENYRFESDERQDNQLSFGTNRCSYQMILPNDSVMLPRETLEVFEIIHINQILTKEKRTKFQLCFENNWNEDYQSILSTKNGLDCLLSINWLIFSNILGYHDWTCNWTCYLAADILYDLWYRQQ